MGSVEQYLRFFLHRPYTDKGDDHDPSLTTIPDPEGKKGTQADL
jgi:hypothetical protein